MMPSMNQHYNQEEKVFNLQLIIQKQEEELRLYRNGTTAQELLELIHEKDIEIETWRTKLEEKEEKLKKLAKTSGDVLMKYEHLQSELQNTFQEKQKLEFDIRSMLDEKNKSDDQVKQQNEEIRQLRQTINNQDQQIGSLRLELWEFNQKSTEVQKQFTDVQISLMESSAEVKHLKDYQQELESLLNDLNTENANLKADKASLELSQAGLNSELTKYKTYLSDQDSALEKLQKRCAVLVTEKTETLKRVDLERAEMITHVQSFRQSMSDNLIQRDEALKKREEKIRDLQFQVQVLQQEVRVLKGVGLGSAPVKSEIVSAAAGVSGVEGGEKKKVLGERTNAGSVLAGGKEGAGKKVVKMAGLSDAAGQENVTAGVL